MTLHPLDKDVAPEACAGFQAMERDKARPAPVDIRITFSTLDKFSESRRFKTLAGARRYARKRMGTVFDIGSTYAVDQSGTGKLTVRGCSLERLLEVQEEERGGERGD